ncbi:MAG: NAD(P)-binding protein [Bacteroidetes bacterium]|nr:NAD(P)-binding protein [Bacteroidota bacterium]
MNRYDVIIIGSGLGSLLCGYILSKEGFSVCILEKHSVPGGCLQSFRRGENSFDTGIHYIGSMLPGQTLHSYWKYFGLSQSLELEQMNKDCFDLISLDGSEFKLAQGFDHFTETLAGQFPASREFLGQYVSALKETVSAFPLYNFQLTDKHTKTAWMGTINSAWRLSHGSTQITDHLIEYISAAGGRVVTGREVKKISSLKNKFQVETAGHEMFVAGRIIAGIHPRSAIGILEPSLLKRSFQSRILSMENTVSSFGLYLGLKPGSFPYLDYNLYYHATRDAWAGQECKTEQWPGMYFMYTPSGSRHGEFTSALCILSTMCFEEVKRWEGTSTGKRGPDYKKFKSGYAEKLLKLVERKFPEIRSSINDMEISTPLTWRDYTGTPEGSMYGIRKESGNYIKTMILPHTKIPGFYFTGQNLNMHGAPGVTIGAIMTCDEILGLEYLFNKIRDAE